jgi:hypothetical protein
MSSQQDKIPASLSFDVKYMQEGKYSVVLYLSLQ